MPRVGTRRSDRRWKARDGVVWASKFEWEVYDALLRGGINVRKCDESDTITYHQSRPNVECLDCGSSRCSQARTYTPDLHITPQGKGSDSTGYYIEVKGYFRDEKRRLFRCLRQSRQDVDIRCIFASDHWVRKGKTRLSDYFTRYIKNTPFFFWEGELPGDWQ
jgi:hypothetical protein